MDFRKLSTIFGLIPILLAALSNGQVNIKVDNALNPVNVLHDTENTTQQNILIPFYAHELNFTTITQGNETKSSKKREAGGDFGSLINSNHEDLDKNLYDTRGASSLVGDQTAIENRRGSLFKNIFKKPLKKNDLPRLKRPPYQYDKVRAMYQPQIPIYDLRRAADMESSGTSDQMITQNSEMRTNAPFSVHPPISPSLETSSESDVVFLKNWHDQFGALFSSEIFPQKSKKPEDNLITDYSNHNLGDKIKTDPKKHRNYEFNESSLDFNFDNFSSLHDIVTDHFKHGKPNKDFGEKSLIDMDDAEVRQSSNFIHTYTVNETNSQDGLNNVIEIVGKPVIKDLHNFKKNAVNYNNENVGSTYTFPSVISNSFTESISKEANNWYSETSSPHHYIYNDENKRVANSPDVSQTILRNTEGKLKKDLATFKHDQLADQPPLSFQVDPYFQNSVGPIYSSGVTVLPTPQQLLPHKNNIASYTQQPWKISNYPFQELPHSDSTNFKKNSYYGHLPPFVPSNYQPYVATNLVNDRIMYPRYNYLPLYPNNKYNSPLRRFGNELKKEREASEYLAISGVALVGALVGYFLLNSAGPLFAGKEKENPMKVVVKGAREGLHKLVVALDEYETNLDEHEVRNITTYKKQFGEKEQLQMQKQYNSILEENHQNLTKIFNNFFVKMTEVLNANGYVKMEEENHFNFSNVLNDGFKESAPNYSMDILVEAVLRDLEKKMTSEAIENLNTKSSNNEALLNNLLQVSSTGQSASEQTKSDVLTENLLYRIYNNNFIENLIVDNTSKPQMPLTTPKNVVLVKELNFIEEDNVVNEEPYSVSRNQKNIKDAQNDTLKMIKDINKNLRQPPLRVVGNTLYKRMNSNRGDSPHLSYDTKNMRFLHDGQNPLSRSNDALNSIIEYQEVHNSLKEELATESKQLLTSKEVAEIKSQIKKIIVNNEEQFVRKTSATPDPRGRQLQLINAIPPSQNAGILNKGVIIKNHVHVPVLAFDH